ncbi:MAG: hypothetical protein ACKVHE_20105 [Planctomycetales bacterium]
MSQVEWARYRFNDDQQTPDTHIVAFEFEGKKSMAWDGMSCTRHRNDFVTFYGEDGAISIDGGGNCTFDAGATDKVRFTFHRDRFP